MNDILQNLGDGLHAVVIGASGGIGGALVEQLAAAPNVALVHAWSRRGGGPSGSKIAVARVDLLDESTLARACQGLTPNLVLVATGLLHDAQVQPEKDWRALDPVRLARSFAVNATGPALAAKHLIPLMDRTRPGVFAALSARVGSIGDNRAGGWYGYRASKAALNQILRCLAIEAARKRPQLVVAGLHPGTVRTDLSAPFQAGVAPDRLFTPSEAATHLLRVVGALTPAQSGRVFAWDGSEITP